MVRISAVPGLRLLPLLAVFSLAGCESMQAVDRGLYRAVDSVSEQDRVTGQRSLSFAGRQGQIRQGNAVVEQLLQQELQSGRKVSSELDARQYRRLVGIFDRVQRIGHLSDERWQAVLIDRPEFNAFTTGGTYIVVHLGLMQQLQDDDEVAAVVAHEIAHTVANHAFERQGHQTLTTLAGSGSAGRDGYQAAFTHESEREADRIGVLYSALAGFDPMAASRIWERQYRQQGNARGLFFHTHPVNSERAAENRETARRVMTYYSPGRENPRAAELLQDNVLWRKSAPVVAAGQGGGVAALLGTALGAYVQHEGARQEEARQQRQIAFVVAVMEEMEKVSETVIDQHSWRVRWRYRGQVPLQGLVMGVMIRDGAGEVQRYIAPVPGSLRPGQAFGTVFDIPDFKVGALSRMQLKYYVDDAQPL
ncbi:M48 family metallopeptidase [Marinobacterium aestuariivivens]|uniref:M48 family metallopeptidase n=1 Tax=Marinobacterium aestuariivivens TaxID=1698799 RepID=A0ABW1ZZA1_9GAMM